MSTGLFDAPAMDSTRAALVLALTSNRKMLSVKARPPDSHFTAVVESLCILGGRWTGSRLTACEGYFVLDKTKAAASATSRCGVINTRRSTDKGHRFS